MTITNASTINSDIRWILFDDKKYMITVFTHSNNKNIIFKRLMGFLQHVQLKKVKHSYPDIIEIHFKNKKDYNDFILWMKLSFSYPSNIKWAIIK